MTLGGGIAHHAQVSLHYQTNVGVGGSEPSAATMLDKIDSHFSSSGHNLSKFTACLDGATALTRTSVYQRLTPGDTDAPGQAANSYSLGGSLTASSDRLPAGIATWLNMRTAKVGRSFRGGTHWPGSFQSADLDANGFWQTGTTFQSVLGTLAAAIVDVINDIDASGTDLNPIIYSLARDRRGDDASEQITSCTISLKPRFVRKRMTQ